ncbi:MAG: hypothetical protein J6Z34_00990, partial [Clostridia bacterium]|nr:hypothetical protein [Clostridia bacterium]
TEVQLVTPEEIDYTTGFYVVSGLTEANAYSRCSFVIKKSGVYKIVVTKISADGEEETVEKYTSFSYSEEYNAFSEKTDEDLIETMKVIVSRGNGSLIEDNEDPYEVFKDFVTELIRTFDPRILFMILVIILFLLDIIVRKFKFKWPHEIIRQIIEKRKQS